MNNQLNSNQPPNTRAATMPRSPQPDMRASPHLRRRRSSCVAKTSSDECPLLSMATSGLGKIDKAIEQRNHSQLSSILQNSIMHYVEQGDEESLVSLLNKISCMLIAGAEGTADSAKAKPSFEDLSKAKTAPGAQDNVYATLRRKSVDLASTLPQLAQPTPHEEECEDEEEVSGRVVKRVEQAMSAMKAGDAVVIVSEEETDKEGALAIAAEMATAEKIAFLVNETCGIIGVATTARRLDELGLPRVDVLDTKSESVDLARHKFEKEKHSGKSAAARAATIRAFAEPHITKADFVRPGNVFPLRAKIKGVLDRPETEEAAMDLARLAGLYPAAAMAELVNKDGNMMQPADCHHFAAQHGLVYLTVGDVVAYRHIKEGSHDASQPSTPSSKSSSSPYETKTEEATCTDADASPRKEWRSQETQTESESEMGMERPRERGTERETRTKFETDPHSGTTTHTTIRTEIQRKPMQGSKAMEDELELDQYARSSEALGCDNANKAGDPSCAQTQSQGVPETRSWEWSTVKKSADGRVQLDQHRVQVHRTTSASSQTSLHPPKVQETQGQDQGQGHDPRGDAASNSRMSSKL